MIRAIILCCDDRNKKVAMKDYAVTPPPPAERCYYDRGALDRSYGDGLNCGYMQERFSYSSGQSPSYTNYRMGWSTGYVDCQGNARHHQGIISTPLPNKYSTRTDTGQINGGMLVTREDREDTPIMDIEENISDDSLSKWPPSGEQQDSLRKGFYTSFNRDMFQDRSDLECPDLWSSLEYPPSPKDAFRETCEFYGDPAVSSKRSRALRKYHQMNGRIEKFYKEKPRRLDLYKSDSKLSHHYGDSSCEESEALSNPIGRSKSLHDLQPGPAIHRQDQPGQVGLSEQDLNRARSVLGLPVSQEEGRRSQSTARVTFPSPCITSTRSPASPSPSTNQHSLNLLKQYYLDCILKIDPNHPVGQTFQKVSYILFIPATYFTRNFFSLKDGASSTRHKKGRPVKNPEYKRVSANFFIGASSSSVFRCGLTPEQRTPD